MKLNRSRRRLERSLHQGGAVYSLQKRPTTERSPRPAARLTTSSSILRNCQVQEALYRNCRRSNRLSSGLYDSAESPPTANVFRYHDAAVYTQTLEIRTGVVAGRQDCRLVAVDGIATEKVLDLFSCTGVSTEP
jgi:hypothetical protein